MSFSDIALWMEVIGLLPIRDTTRDFTKLLIQSKLHDGVIEVWKDYVYNWIAFDRRARS